MAAIDAPRFVLADVVELMKSVDGLVQASFIER